MARRPGRASTTQPGPKLPGGSLPDTPMIHGQTRDITNKNLERLAPPCYFLNQRAGWNHRSRACPVEEHPRACTLGSRPFYGLLSEAPTTAVWRATESYLSRSFGSAAGVRPWPEEDRHD